MTTALSAPAVAGLPRLLLQLEGAGLLILSCALYHWGGMPWWIFVVFFFSPDVAFIAYLLGPRPGAIVYDLLHTTVGPAALIIVAIFYDYAPAATVGAAIWAAHIGYDRMLGYGLKYPTGYKDTHLGRLWWPPEEGGWLPRRPSTSV